MIAVRAQQAGGEVVEVAPRIAVVVALRVLRAHPLLLVFVALDDVSEGLCLLGDVPPLLVDEAARVGGQIALGDRGPGYSSIMRR